MPSIWIVWIIFQEYGYSSFSFGKVQGAFEAEQDLANVQMCRPTKIAQHDALNQSLQPVPNQSISGEYLRHEPGGEISEYQSSPTIKHQQQLQYIDYKIHYGLRYNPRYGGTKTNVPKLPPSEDSTRNDTNVTSDVEGSILERKKVALPKPPNKSPVGGPILMQYDPAASSLLSVFNIITFVNGPCVPRKIAPGKASFVASWTGICYHEKECSQLKGTAMDTCAGGFGVCCVFQYGCDSSTEQNVSYFLSPHFPAPTVDALPCSFTLALQRSVRQVVLEFIFFELQPPQLGNCVEDQFVVSIQNDHRIYPVLCGINSGQHMYLDVDRAYSHRLFLNAVFNSRQPRAFLVKVTQLATPRAPSSCLQFHEALGGVVQSFNYDNSSTIVKNLKSSYFNNLNYAICIKRHIMFCDVVFTNENALGNENIFQMVNIAEDGSSLVPANQAGAEIFSCPGDFIAINYIRLCGERLNDGSLVADFTVNKPVSHTSAGPIVVAVRSDQSTVGRGFKLTYKQHVCIDKIV